MTQIVKAPLAGRREWLALAVLTVPTMLAMLDLNVVILALPRISATLKASGTESLWLTSIYGFMIAGFLVTMGRVGDRIGYRKLLLTGAAAFGLLSVVAAYSHSAPMLIVVRALLGIAGATLMPTILALIKGMFPDPQQMSTAMGIWSTAMMAGIAFGPAIGGLLLNWFWYGSIFLIAVPVMALLLIAGPFLITEARGSQSGQIEPLSILLSLATILPIIYGLTELARVGWAVVPIASIIVGLACGWLFSRRQRGLRDPLLDVRLFKIPAIGGTLVLFLFAGALQGGTGFLMTQHLQLVEGFSPLKTAVWLLVPTVVVVLGIQISLQLAKRIRPASVLIGGAVVASIGMVVLTQVSAVGGLTTLIVGLCILFLGTSSVPMLSNQLVMQAAPKDKAGSAASLTTTSGDLGTALGIAGLGSLATAFYQSHLQVPSHVSPAAAAAAKESISRAVATAAGLPSSSVTSLLASARDAFNSAFTLSSGVCAVLFIGLAALVYFTLRGIPPIGNKEPENAAMATTTEFDRRNSSRTVLQL